MNRLFACLCFLTPILAFAASPFEGRWRLDKARSSALDGWSDWDLVISQNGDRVTLGYEMQWRTTKVSGANTVDLTKTASIPNFFRVDQRHSAVYAATKQPATVTAGWLDHQRTLRVEADAPVEVSQGDAMIRIYSEFRLVEGDRELLLIELHSTRPRPLTYRFTKVTPDSK